MLMFGRELEPIRHVRRELSPGEDEEDMEDVDYPSFVRSKGLLEDLRELVKCNQIKASNKQAVYYNKRRNVDVSYEVGEKCWRRNFRLSKADAHYNASLDQKYCGPYVVSARLSPVVYSLSDLEGRIEGNYHIKDLRKFVEDSEEAVDMVQEEPEVVVQMEPDVEVQEEPVVTVQIEPKVGAIVNGSDVVDQDEGRRSPLDMEAVD